MTSQHIQMISIIWKRLIIIRKMKSNKKPSLTPTQKSTTSSATQLSSKSNGNSNLNPQQLKAIKNAQQRSQEYFHIVDNRSPGEIQLQHRETQEMYRLNLKVFQVQMTEKAKVQYKPAQLFKVDVGNNWYGMITDNQLNTQFTVFTVHGSPGDHREWAGLQKQMNGSIRWINFVIPGFDGLDQRRGNYSGTAEDLSKLIRLILQQRKVYKIIYIGHSMGSIFGSYFINKNLDIVKGYMNVTGIVNQWYVGLLTFYRFTSAAYGFNRGPNHASMIRLLNKAQYRQQHHRRFIADTRDVWFGTKVQFPQLTVTQMCAYIKLFSSLPRGCSQFYQLNQKLRILRILVFGKNDPLHQPHKTQESIYSITRGRFRFDQYKENAKLIALMKQQLEQTLKEVHGVQIEAQKIQQYFCYHFDETGHNAHKRRPKQLSRILRIYVTVLKVMQKYQPLAQTRL